MNANSIKGIYIGALAAASLAYAANSDATVLDLTTVGASGSLNGGYFQQIDSQSTGTGVIDPIVRIQATGTESGFNNNVDKFTLDDVAKGGQTYNHDIQLSAVPIVTINSTDYYQFLLDINQTNANPLLSLDTLEIWLKGGPISSLAGATGVYSDLTGSGATKAYDLGIDISGASNYILLNYDLNAGSGAGDMFANIPVSALGIDGSKYVYLYSFFGNHNASNDGFEEWATLSAAAPPPPSMPDPGTLSLFCLGLVGLGGAMRRRKTH